MVTAAEAVSAPYPDESAFPATTLKLLFALAVGLLAAGGLRPRSRSAQLIAAALASLGLAADLAMPATLYRELHDLAGLTAIAGGLALARPLRERLARLSGGRLAAWLSAAAAVSLAAVLSVDAAAPGWRAQAWQHARAEPRLARAARALCDFDGDGFSPIVWGGDCDDLDARKNPLAHDRPGGPDANCNGTSPPLEPSDDQRGLAPPFGEPSYPPGTVDRVVLVTIDCLRADALRPDVMPRLARLAADGLTMTRLYAGGSSTLRSLPLIQRGRLGGAAVAERLAAHGVRTALVFPFRSTELRPEVAPGFRSLHAPEKPVHRWSASDATDLALAELDANAAAPLYLWLHYFDAHQPYERPLDGAPRPLPPLPGLDAASAEYLGELAYIDRQLGRLLDALAAKGRLARTLIVVTSDHGEGLGEHGITQHSVSGYEALVHVPAILVGPGIAPGRYDQLTSHRDLPATVLGAFQLADADAERMGRSWLRLRAGLDRPLHRFVVSYSARSARAEVTFGPMAAIVEGPDKLVETFEDGLLELYRPERDPAERADLTPSAPDDAQRLRRDLALYRDIDQFP
jgi:arylsulfatase A-like enzyme